MAGRESRRVTILEVASQMFIERGYHATTVRQIAQAVGCTEAALYYHFKGGKRDLLQHVIESAEIDLRADVLELERSISLDDLAERYGAMVAKMQGGRIHRTIRWITYEMPTLTLEERRPFYDVLLNFQRDLACVVACFVDNPDEASKIAWLLLCTSFGFRQIFADLEVGSLVQVDVTALFNLLANAFVPTEAAR